MVNSLKMLIFAAFICSVALCQETGSVADSTPAAGTRIRLLRSICGSGGSQEGDRFVVEDPRSVFYLPEDRQVVVYVELAGPIGKHRIQGFWKRPDGQVSSFSDFSYTSQEETFSAHFTLGLLESAVTGNWSLDVNIDGEPVSQISFLIAAGKRSAAPTASRKVLTVGEIYNRAAASTVTIERIGKDDRVLGASQGFVAFAGMVFSSFSAIDGASRLRVIFPSGARQETSRILSCSRQRGYSVIAVDTGDVPGLRLARANSILIGDNVSLLEVAHDGGQVISQVKVVGKSFPAARLNLSHPVSDRAIGGALFDEYGDVIGVVDSLTYPWIVSSSDVIRMSRDSNISRGSAVLIETINVKEGAPTTLEKLLQKGELLPSTSGEHILDVQIFAGKGGKIGLYVIWEPKEKLRGVVNLVIAGADSRVVIPADKRNEKKISLRPGRQVVTSWDLDVSHLLSGVYRVEITVDSIAYWRTSFLLTK